MTGRFVLVLEDLAVDNCEFPDTLHPLSAEQATLIVDLLARLHATFWGRIPDWLHSASADSASLIVGPLLKTSARRIAERTDIAVDDGPVHRRQLPRRGAADRHTAAHGHAR